jgi:hypothetical protein
MVSFWTGMDSIQKGTRHMKRTALATLACLAWAASAAASTITIDNLWPYEGYDITSVVLWASDIPITSDATIAPGASLSLELPSALDNGFRFDALGIGGICPTQCGWFSGVSTQWAGDWIALGTVIDVLWPATDGGDWLPLAHVTYAASPSSTSVPEPSSLALFGAGILAVVFRRWRT